MISYLKGSVLSKHDGSITLLTQGGVGYEVYMTDSDFSSLHAHEEVTIFCYTHSTERTQELYGFLKQSAQELFTLLVSYAAGIGPKSALKILSKGSTDILYHAIASQNTDKLIALGIGAKTAENIMLGLKGRIGDGSTLYTTSPEQKDALDALVHLGYSHQEAKELVSRIDTHGKSIEEIIREALKRQ